MGDMCLTCFERALQSAESDTQGDIWYNISHIAIGIGDLGLAYQALKVALAADPSHVEAQNNLAVLELKKGNIELARGGSARHTGWVPTPLSRPTTRPCCPTSW